VSADKSGKQPPLSHFADFKVFDENGEVDFTHKYEGQDGGEAKTVRIRVVQQNHLLRVYEVCTTPHAPHAPHSPPHTHFYCYLR